MFVYEKLTLSMENTNKNSNKSAQAILRSRCYGMTRNDTIPPSQTSPDNHASLPNDRFMPSNNILRWRISANAVVLREERFSDGSAFIETDEGILLLEAIVPWDVRPARNPKAAPPNAAVDGLTSSDLDTAPQLAKPELQHS